jgi:uncharacterized phage infection (PIP) family protein YhgE
MSKNKQKDSCLACNKTFTKSDASIQCAICCLWIHHKPCSGVSEEGFKFLCEQLQATGTAYWACRSCMAYSKGITQKVREVEKKLEEVQKDVKENASKLDRVDQNVENLKKELEKVKNKNKDEAATFITAEEYRERESRRMNVVMHRVKEPTTNLAEDKKKADIKECENILSAIGLQQECQEIRTCRRIGEKGEAPRPLVLVMNNESSRSAILAAARKLRQTQYNDISVVPDLTQQQRQEEAGLSDEAARRNQEELTEEDVQKNLTWMVVGQRGARKIIKANNRNRQEYSQRGRGHAARGGTRGRIPAVPQPMGRPAQQTDGLSIQGQELLPSRKRTRDYRPAKTANPQGAAGAAAAAEETMMEEQVTSEEEEETGSPAHKK